LRVLDLNSYSLIDVKEGLMTAERTTIKVLGFEMWSIEHATVYKAIVKLLHKETDQELI
jgi:hypothetical protein